jgi:hypothetical protein
VISVIRDMGHFGTSTMEYVSLSQKCDGASSNVKVTYLSTLLGPSKEIYHIKGLDQYVTDLLVRARNNYTVVCNRKITFVSEHICRIRI